MGKSIYYKFLSNYNGSNWQMMKNLAIVYARKAFGVYGRYRSAFGEHTILESVSYINGKFIAKMANGRNRYEIDTLVFKTLYTDSKNRNNRFYDHVSGLIMNLRRMENMLEQMQQTKTNKNCSNVDCIDSYYYICRANDKGNQYDIDSIVAKVPVEFEELAKKIVNELQDKTGYIYYAVPDLIHDIPMVLSINQLFHTPFKEKEKKK